MVDIVEEPISYAQFEEVYLAGNRPCILSCNLLDSWPSYKNWVVNDCVNVSFLRTHYGDVLVPVADCESQRYDAQEKVTMTMNQYLDYFDSVDRSSKSLYLKDWHFRRASSDDVYAIPEYFKSDWLNEYQEALGNDYKFVYAGTAGSWTPLHCDVFRSYSWSANLCGRKHWVLFPRGEEAKLRRGLSGRLPYRVTFGDGICSGVPESGGARRRHNQVRVHEEGCVREEIGKESGDRGCSYGEGQDASPNSRLASDERAKSVDSHTPSSELPTSISVVQYPGEVIFVPSGWYHQVRNLDDVLSINHNWVNGHNILDSFTFLRCELADVRWEIRDCEGMAAFEEQCELILNANTGMGYRPFVDMLECILRNREQGPVHPDIASFDATALHRVLSLMVTDEHVTRLELTSRLRLLIERSYALLASQDCGV